MSGESSGQPVTRRRLLVTGGGIALAALAAGRLAGGAGDGDGDRVQAVRPAPPGRPDRQHVWDAVLRTDAAGNRLAPRHHRLVHLSLTGPPTVAAAAVLEDALRALEERYPLGPAGLLVAVGWSAAWFAAVGRPSPVPAPTAITADEAPALDAHAACVHLASDREEAVASAERRLRGALRPPLAVADVRAGAVGAGFARRIGRGANGVPPGQPPRDSPLLMGFASGRRRNQAGEDDVTVADGPWAGATTMHVSVLSLALATWFGSLDDDQRAARMFAPGIDARRARATTAGLELPGDLARTARRHGLVGHAQAAATARVGGRPRILRRDFNGRDSDQPLVHFVSLQRTVEDFAATRRAMAATAAVDADRRVGAHVNNGINEWITTRSRANYLVPVRSRRSCPGLAGWDA
ncbi:DUF7405 family protein [Conexibacter woesei]|uniref:Tat pathway signal protein n=1 Tax=Conexibacter woesei (strain DSM 14684 / CCUG 47730 / CIP 108061 / JCM 11494 / NBRC 100937 / ID131577) TaxID=469383 RepID=D3F6B2_CONWI|nr:hypothetical protein [Conexibacter woesei]ADB50679.1 hypothetical protein Cwoe_2254 [Conexibacter woesei DSM 14684]